MTQKMLVEGADVNEQDLEGATPLHWAADRGTVGVAAFLLEHAADVSIVDKSGMTALHYAACSGQQEVRWTTQPHMLRVHPTITGVQGQFVGDESQHTAIWYPGKVEP
jgi:hypothetical protein